MAVPPGCGVGVNLLLMLSSDDSVPQGAIGSNASIEIEDSDAGASNGGQACL